MPSVYDENNFAGRVNYAAQCFLANRHSRHFDTCFEMFDGDAVVTALVRRCAKNEKLREAIARQWRGTFPQSWLDKAQEYKDIPQRKLGELAAGLRARAAASYA